MARRVTPAQLRSRIRQEQRRQQQGFKQAVNKAERDVNRKLQQAVNEANRKNKRAVDEANRKNQRRLQQELRRLASTSTTRYVVYRESVVTLTSRFSAIDGAVEAGRWVGGNDLLDLAEGEAANSVEVLRALDGTGDARDGQDEHALQVTTLDVELSAISTDLAARWGGALYALSPRNPEAARQFCTSAREIVTSILDIEAPDDVVLASDPSVQLTDDGRVVRRAKVDHLLKRASAYDPTLADFVDADVANVLTLFRVLNDGTHGSAGRFDLVQLGAIKNRMEDAVRFLHRIVRRQS